MRKLSLATVGLAALVAVPAMGADVAVRRPVRPPPPPLPPVFFTWTGCFIGGHIGGLWARKDWFDHTFDSDTFGLSDGGHDADGFLGGVQGGCDYQFAGGFVIGIQGDYAWTDADGSSPSILFPGDINHSSIDSLASITGRVGYAWDRFLGYVRAGGAWERDEYHISSPGAFVVATASETRGGWTVGIGGEYAFTNFLTAFVEYNYYDFGDRDLTFVTPTSSFVLGIDETKSVLKGGLNFRFGGWGAPPVVARY
jgi:outer membrane immunogenic protein